MVEAEPMEVVITLKLHVRDQDAMYVCSNITGLHALTRPKEENPKFSQEYLDEVGEDTVMKMIKDFGEYQDWCSHEWKPASTIFKN